MSMHTRHAVPVRGAAAGGGAVRGARRSARQWGRRAELERRGGRDRGDNDSANHLMRIAISGGLPRDSV